MPSIYICIPVYNVQDYLEECLNSALSQTYENISIVCVDDGSTDRSSAILSDYESKYSSERLTVIRKPNGGPSSARNAALDYLKGKEGYIYFLDADDSIEPTHIANLVEIAEKEHADIVCSSFNFYNGKSKHPFRGMDNVFGVYTSVEATRLLLEDRTIQSHSPTKLYKLGLWKNLKYPETVVQMEDQGTVFQTFYLADRIVFLKEYGYNYRQHGNSLCSSGDDTKKAISSLIGYAIPLDFPFNRYSEEERQIVLNAARQAYAACFLMMYPRYHKKLATEEQKNQFSRHLRYINKNHLIQHYRPAMKKEKRKRFVYLYFRPFYKLAYRIFA